MRQGSTRRELGGADLGVGAVLFATLGSPVAWSLHLGVCYFLAALACTTSWRGPTFTLAILGVTALAAGVSVASGVVAYRRWRALGGADRWDQALSAPGGRGGFYWILGLTMSVLFTLVIVLGGLPPLFVPTCAPVP